MTLRYLSLGILLQLVPSPPLVQAHLVEFVGLVFVAGTKTPLADAEAAVLDLQRSALSGPDGRFSIRDIPPGSYVLRLRRIGYQPQLVRIAIAEGAAKADTFRLEEQAVNLPALDVEGHLPQPTFVLQLDYTIDVRMSITHPPRNYLPFGAVMTDDMEAFVFAAPSKGSQPILSARRWLHELSGYGEQGATPFACPARSAPPLGLQLLNDAPTYLALYPDGLVQLFISSRPPRKPTCTPFSHVAAEVHPISAAGAAGRWVVTTSDTNGEPVALGLEGAQITWRLPLSVWLSGEDLASARVSARGTIVTIGVNRWPFTWVAVDSVGSVRAVGGLLSPDGHDSSTRFARFRDADAFPVLPIENGYVQTLVGSNGEPRVNVVYDMLGRVASVQEGLGIPLFLASAPTVRRLLGVHVVPNRTRVGHLVEYAY